jgi:hypothetical protein
MYGNGGPLLPEKRKGKLSRLLCELSSDEDEVAEEGDHDVGPQSSWLKELTFTFTLLLPLLMACLLFSGGG